GRKRQLDALDDKYNSDRKQFGVIYGRRRIGKTETVKSFLEGKEYVYFQALKGTTQRNLKEFSMVVNSFTGQSKYYVFPSWKTALEEIDSYFSGHRYCLVIDEYPFIASRDRSFSSVIEAFYDGARDNLFLILLGSDVSFLNDEINDRASPLYKRRTFEMRLGKMPLSEALLFLDGLPSEDKINYLSLMSSYPYYLSAIDKTKSFDENVVNLLFYEYGAFANLPEGLPSDTSRIQDVYNTILESIAGGHHGVKEITDDIGESGAVVSTYISSLLGGEIIEKRSSFNAGKKGNYYVISDPLLRFWYAFVYPNQNPLPVSEWEIFSREKEHIHHFLCHGFEDTAILYLEELNFRGELDEMFTRIKNFNEFNKKLDRQVEIDGLAQSGDTLLVVECKYETRPFTNEMARHLRESASIFADRWKRVYYIFSGSGFSPDFDYEPDFHCFTSEDILKSGRDGR
ncbi:MAG: ATP-binding protein, partial [Clostridia bacterium]|nr:ATP-binding protein [Clostridia bacterium]